MNIRPSFAKLSLTFGEVRSLGPNFSNARALPEKVSSIPLDVPGPIDKWRTDFLFAYDIFPRNIMRFEAEWLAEHRPMKIGDVILQRALLPPIGFGFCTEFAVRICALAREPKKLGFTYETLAGHAERGTSEFYFEEKDSQLHFTIHTFSEPAHWSSRLGKSFFTLPYQNWCTQQALRHVRDRFRELNPT